jgi:hypothetical protein
MKPRWFLLAPLLGLVGSAFAAGCGSSSSGEASDGGVGNGACVAENEGGPPAACVISKQAALTPARVKEVCMQNHGQWAPSCPMANLVGCCTAPPVVETCYYMGAFDASASPQESQCMSMSGAWSATP